MASLLDEYMALNDVDPAHLEHYGVKGMKWGVRRARDTSSPKTPSRRQQKKIVKAKVKAAEAEFYNQKGKRMMEIALKDPENLIQLRPAGEAYPTVVSGREFTNYVSNGGVFDIKTSDVFAVKNASGTALVVNDRINERFDRKKAAANLS